MIYYVSDGRGRIKIGHTNTDGWFDELQEGNADRLVLLAKEAGGLNRLQEIYEALSCLRYQCSSPNWFWAHSDLLDYISTLPDAGLHHRGMPIAEVVIIRLVDKQSTQREAGAQLEAYRKNPILFAKSRNG